MDGPELGHLGQVAQEHVPVCSKYHQGWRLHSITGQLGLMPVHPPHKMLYLMLKGNFPYLRPASKATPHPRRWIGSHVGAKPPLWGHQAPGQGCHPETPHQEATSPSRGDADGHETKALEIQLFLLWKSIK